jgi:AbrB family looped-hinge helix DNA binding protein
MRQKMNNSPLTQDMKVESDGRIIIPREVASEMGFSADSKVVLIKRGKSILLFPKEDFLPFLDALSDRMQEELENTGGLKADAKFIFDLSVEEYFKLHEKTEKELWDKHYAQESERMDKIEDTRFGD